MLKPADTKLYSKLVGASIAIGAGLGAALGEQWATWLKGSVWVSRLAPFSALPWRVGVGPSDACMR